MVKNIAKQTLRRVALEEPKEIVKEVVSQVTAESQEPVEQPSGQALKPQTPDEKRKKEELAQRRLAQLEGEIRILREKRRGESQERKEEEKEKKVHQIEVEEAKKEPPVVAMAKTKAGTGERRIKGISG